MSDEEILISVEEFARAAHGGQLRKYSPDPYIVHPIRVMKMCREYTKDVAILSAGLLHDVLEDTPLPPSEMLSFLKGVMGETNAVRTFALVKDLTDVYIKKDYPHLNRAERKKRENDRLAKAHSDAQTIKYADIIDNCIDIAANDRGFAPRYVNECRKLLSVINKGNADLYIRAKKTLETAL
jgi:guanosine-3',5'-bis(diphosphate) 3'-pyrophosphohydrolase